MVLEELPYDYPLICPSGSSHDVRVGSMLRSSLSLPSRYLESTSPYIPGDPLKSLDWRILARRDEWMVRRHHPPTQRHYGLIVDGSSAMHWPDKAFIRAHHLEDISKWQVAMRIACHLSYHLSGGGREMDVVLWNPPDPGPEEGLHGSSSGPSPSTASYALRRLRRPEDAARCYNILTQESSNASSVKRWWPTEEQYENRSIPAGLHPWEFFDAAFAQQQRWLLITDAINSHTRLLIKRHPELRIIHLLSRLELDSSWLKTSFHYRCSPLSSQIYHGRRLRSSARKALDHLLRSSALRQSQHYTSLNSQSTLELYLENLREVL